MNARSTTSRRDAPRASALPSAAIERSAAPPAERGFVLVAVLVISGVVATLAAAWAHHVVAGNRSSLASPDALAAREAAASHLDVARQALLTGSAVPAQLTDAHGVSTALTVLATGVDTRSIAARTELPGGEVAERTVTATLRPDPSPTPGSPDELPHLPDALVAALLADPGLPKLHYTADTVIEGAELSGLVVVHDGVKLTLRDVVLTGAVLSEQALAEGDFGSFDAYAAPTLDVAGTLRIDPAGELPSVAILMPDGVVQSSGSTGALQLGGDVVAHAVELTRPALVDGHVLSVMSPQLGADVELIGDERKPAAWSTDLEYGELWELSTLAVESDATSVAALSAITAYWESH